MSLAGDLFPPDERGRLFGVVLSGELIGGGFGIAIAGTLSGWAGWRPALAVLILSTPPPPRRPAYGAGSQTSSEGAALALPRRNDWVVRPPLRARSGRLGVVISVGSRSNQSRTARS